MGGLGAKTLSAKTLGTFETVWSHKSLGLARLHNKVSVLVTISRDPSLCLGLGLMTPKIKVSVSYLIPGILLVSPITVCKTIC